MAKKFVRGITDIKQINQQDFDTNNVNDLLSDGEYNYIHRKKKDKSEEYHNLTDNIKTISSDNTDLLSVTNDNKSKNTATLHPHHDALKEQVIESERNTIDIHYGENGTSEKTKVDTNPQKVLEHDNLSGNTDYVKVHHAGGTNTTLIDSALLINKFNTIEQNINTLTDIRNLGDGHVFTLAGDATRYIYAKVKTQPKAIMNIVYEVYEHSYFDNRNIGNSPKLKTHNDYTAYIVPVTPNTTISANRNIGDVYSQYLDTNLKVVGNIKDSLISTGVYNVPSNAQWAYITINSSTPNLVVVNHESLGKDFTYSELQPQEVYGYVFNNTVIPKNKFDELLSGETSNIELHVGSGQPYSTIKQALNAVNNPSKNKVYDIVCHEGNHYFSMLDSKLPDYVNIKGSTGNYEDVVIIGEVADSADDYTISQTATFNVSKNNNFENVTITGKNMRYTIHDESSGTDKNWIRKVTNCRIIHYGNQGAVNYRNEQGQSTTGIWTVTRAWGEGTSSGAKSYYDNVIFESPVQPYYCHEPNAIDSTKPYFKQFNNCVFKTTKNEYGGFGGGVTIDNNNQRTLSKNVIIFNNCSFERGKIQINGDVPIDVRIHGSNNTPIQVSNVINYPKTDNTMLFYYDGNDTLNGFEKLTINQSKGYEYVVKATASTPTNEIVGVNVSGAVSKGQTVMTSNDKFIFNKNQLIIN